MSKSFLLLGGVLPAVHLLRRAQECVNDIHIIAQNDDAIALSKYGEKILYIEPKDCLVTIRQWIAEQNENAQQWLVIPCSEFFVQYVEEFRNSGFEVFAPSSEALRTFYDKTAMYSWLESLGIEIADFKQLDEQLNFADQKRYIVKSAKSSDNYKPPFKIKIISQEEELDEIRRVIPKQYWNNFVIQRLYQNNQSISYGGVWLEGKEVASVIVRQVRQYPQGITSYAIKETNVECIKTIKEVIAKIASNVDLNGFIELEFIKNETGLYPIDLNPRLWGWSNFLFYNFPQIPYVISKGQYLRQIENNNIESWSNIWRDIPAILTSERSITLNFKSTFALFKVSKKDLVFWSDVKPEFSAILQKLGKGKK